MDFDVVIVGAGPAGCAAAISCVQHNLRTLILHKSSTDKGDAIQPSESIHPGIETILIRLKASHCIQLASKGVYEGIQYSTGYAALGSDENGTWLGNHIIRNKFDSELLKCVQTQGAEILQDENLSNFIIRNDRVVGIQTTSGKIITSKYVIDATGYKRVAGKKLQFREQFFSPPLVSWTGISRCTDSNVQKVPRFLPNTSGWTWIAPEASSHYTWTRLAMKGKQIFSPPTELKDFPIVGKVKVVNSRWRIFRPLCREGIILCGDAAGIIDPAAGRGILNALMSGIVAADTVKLIAENPSFEAMHLARYDDWFLTNFEQNVEKLKELYSFNGIFQK